MGTKHNLDVMRSIAVCAVLVDHVSLVTHHTNPFGLDLGWLGVFGVYLFFVHTCLVLMWSLERRPHTLDFYVRRVFRIYPLAVLAVALTLLSRLPWFTSTEPRDIATCFSNFLLIQNLWRHPNILGVLWSLPLEVQMYILLPALFLFARRERALWPFLVIWVLACLADRATYGPKFGNDLFAVIPHFLPGVMAYIGYKNRRPSLPSGFFLVLLTVLCWFFLQRPSPQRGWFVCLLLGLGLPFFRDFAETGFTRAGHLIAQYSYGVYLLHPFAIWISFGFFAHLALATRLLIFVLLTAVFSMLAYHLVEHPFVRLGARVANRMQQRFGTDYAMGQGLDLA